MKQSKQNKYQEDLAFVNKELAGLKWKVELLRREIRKLQQEMEIWDEQKDMLQKKLKCEGKNK